MAHLLTTRFIHWSSVGAVSSSFAARATIFIPLFGYMVIFNEKMVDYLNLVGILHANEGHAGISARLVFLYMGLCFIAAAVAVYALRCPSDIKGFSTAAQYIANVQNTISGPSLRNIEVAISSEPSLELEFQAVRTVRRDQEVRDDNEYFRALLFLYFGLLDRSREFSRFFCIIFYALGFSLISLPSFSVFLKISKIFLDLTIEGFGRLIHW